MSSPRAPVISSACQVPGQMAALALTLHMFKLVELVPPRPSLHTLPVAIRGWRGDAGQPEQAQEASPRQACAAQHLICDRRCPSPFTLYSPVEQLERH